MNNNLNVTKWNCVDDLSPYFDSMLFDSGTSVCDMMLEDNSGVKIELDIVVSGSVSVTYKGETYHKPSEFPEELRNKIISDSEDFAVYAPSGEGNDDEEGECYCSLNNWFEVIFKLTTPRDEFNDGFTDGSVLEENISNMTPDELKAVLVDYAESIYEHYGLGK